jgi:hypothetical protein
MKNPFNPVDISWFDHKQVCSTIIHLRGYQAHEAPQFIAGSMSQSKQAEEGRFEPLVIILHREITNKNNNIRLFQD